MHYKWKTGMWAFVLHRVTGLALSVYLVAHIHVISSLHNPQKFDEVMKLLSQPHFKLLEIGLLLTVIYHALNGVRVFLIDFAYKTRSHAPIWWTLILLGLVIFLLGTYPFLHHAGIF